jgi:hypothetical protein
VVWRLVGCTSMWFRHRSSRKLPVLASCWMSYCQMTVLRLVVGCTSMWFRHRSSRKLRVLANYMTSYCQMTVLRSVLLESCWIVLPLREALRSEIPLAAERCLHVSFAYVSPPKYKICIPRHGDLFKADPDPTQFGARVQLQLAI